MLPTARALQLLAQEIGFEARSLEKVIRLAELLDGIESLENLQDSLALKGGTALNLIFGPPSREAWTVLSPLLELTEVERQFCDQLQAGTLQPDLLFPESPDIADRIRRHPALLWKAQNALGHTSQARSSPLPDRQSR